MNVFWYIVPSDGRYPWQPKGSRVVDYAYLQQLTRAVDTLGYTGALFATAGGAHDAWVTAASLIPFTERLKFIIAVHPGLMSPLMLAQKAATFDQFSKGRLILNVITGEQHQLPPHGVYLDHDERYALTDEYWSVWRRLMQGETVTYEGKYVSLKNAKLNLPALQSPYPELYFGGSSEPALKVAAKQVDTYLTWGEPVDAAARKIARVRELASEQGRSLKFGIRLNVIVRETREEAWAAADWLLGKMDKDAIDVNLARQKASDSVGQARMSALFQGKPVRSARDLEIAPDLWAGLGLVRAGPGTALVGDPQTVAARLQEYREAGFDTFILSGYPLLEEAYRVSDLLLPLLPVAGRQEAQDDPQRQAWLNATGASRLDRRETRTEQALETAAATLAAGG